jgi:hypothetical protein
MRSRSVLLRRQRSVRVAVALLATTVAVAGCSSGGSEAVDSQSIATLKENLLTTADINRAPTGSPLRAFLQYWSAAQFRAWSALLSMYEPALVNRVSVATLVEGLKSQATYFQTLKPVTQGVVRVGDQAIVRYKIPDGAGQLYATSMSLRRSGDTWRIHYDPQLDSMLQTGETVRVQSATNPNAPKQSKAALVAGANAGQLQSYYLQSQYQGASKPKR